MDNSSNTKAYLALAFICFTWGTTYLALRIGVADFPPLLFAGIRQTMAGLLLLTFAKLIGKGLRVRWEDVRNQVIPGILMITIGNGVVAWSAKFIPSGLAAIIVSIMPIYVVLINLAKGQRKAVNGTIISGLFLGLAGLLMIFKDRFTDIARPEYFWGAVVMLFSAFGWALGSVYLKSHPGKNHPFIHAALQLAIGGIAMLLVSPLLENWGTVHAMTNDTFWALLYLIAIGSISSYICYLYALRHLPVGLVSVHAYVNPIVAVLLGYVVLDEQITTITVIAMMTILGSVYLMNRGYQSVSLPGKK